ncbi:uncharacterized protein G2W53_012164 [Senna tora]|uniref:Uncharacterized protein n=1 Tax=Senna tora TaxID=362788 RepID=A0A834U0A5_9FABA|nr:uncharacterized protein G2W53_012164 [Senna tora]
MEAIASKAKTLMSKVASRGRKRGEREAIVVLN